MPLSPSPTLHDAPTDVEKGTPTSPRTSKSDFDARQSPTSGEEKATAVPPQLSLSKWRKAVILTFLCSAQFFDIFNSGSVIAALPEIGHHLSMSLGVSQWVLSAYSLTLGAFMVPSGRLADIYHPKPVFCIGYLALGIFSIVCGASVQDIMLIVFRALSGIGAAMTIPASISMIVQIYPDPKEKSRALGIFGSAGAVGLVTGFVLGGVLTARLGWRWVFYIVAILTIPFAVASYFLLPSGLVPTSETKRSLDLPGVSALTAGLILFVYAISDANTSGWGSAQVITTLVFSIVCFVGFFVIERFVTDPVIPPRTWSNKNFAPMFFYSWSVYWSLMTSELLLIQVFQDLFGWSTIKAALHCIPFGAVGGTTSYLVGSFGHKIPQRVLLISGQVLMAAGVVLYALTDSPEKYWTRFFPGVFIHMTGLAAAYVGSTTTTMAGARAGEEGVVGAALNTSYQIGSTIGVAIVTAVSLGVSAKQPTDAFAGYAAAFWSVLGMHGVMLVVTVIFVRN